MLRPPRVAPARSPRRQSKIAGPRTLAIDIGGSGLKALVVDRGGSPVTDRLRVETPRPATPQAILSALVDLVRSLHPFDRVAVGFPGVVFQGAIKTAPNLDPSWSGIELAKELTRRLGKPTRVLNDAGVQGFGVVEGKGLEMVLTLGTGLGCALFYDGTYIPNLELAHHPYRKGRTYEEYLGQVALERDGKRKWNRRLARALAVIDQIWNPDRIYLGGGNAKYVKIPLAVHVSITPNVAGLYGGIALWEGREGLELAKESRAAKTAARPAAKANARAKTKDRSPKSGRRAKTKDRSPKSAARAKTTVPEVETL